MCSTEEGIQNAKTRAANCAACTRHFSLVNEIRSYSGVLVPTVLDIVYPVTYLTTCTSGCLASRVRARACTGHTYPPPQSRAKHTPQRCCPSESFTALCINTSITCAGCWGHSSQEAGGKNHPVYDGKVDRSSPSFGHGMGGEWRGVQYTRVWEVRSGRQAGG